MSDGETLRLLLLEELNNLLHVEQDVRKQAELHLKHLQFKDGYGITLTEIIMTQNLNLATRQLACSVLTRFIEDRWAPVGNDADPVITPQEKHNVRVILPNGLYDTNSKIRSGVAHAMSIITSVEDQSDWPNFFDVIMKCLGGNEHSIHGAVSTLLDANWNFQQIEQYGPGIVSEVLRILGAEQQYGLETRTLSLQMLKPMLTEIAYTTNRSRQTQLVNLILPTFMSKFSYYLSAESGSVSNFQLRTEIIKLFNMLITQMPSAVKPFVEKILPTIWQLLTQLADTYVKVIVNCTQRIPGMEEGSGNGNEYCDFENLLTNTFEFITCIIMSGKLNACIKDVLSDLFYILIVYMQVPKELTRHWAENPHTFIYDEGDNGIDLTVRAAGKDLISTISDEYDKEAIPALQQALARHFSVAEAEQSAGNPDWWKIHEACMIAEYSFRNGILEGSQYFDLANYLVALRNMLNTELPFLDGRALCTLSAYTKSELFTVLDFAEFVNTILAHFAPTETLTTRLSAVRATLGLLDANMHSGNEKHALIKPNLRPFLDSTVALVSDSSGNMLSILLETLTALVRFSGDFAYSSHDVTVPLALAVFVKFIGDPILSSDAENFITAIARHKQCSEPLQAKFLPALANILSLQGELATKAKQDSAFYVLSAIVKNASRPLADRDFNGIFPVMMQCVLNSEDHSTMVAGSECLRNFISLSPEQVCQYNNGQGIEMVVRMTTNLLDPMSDEQTAGQVGRLVIIIIMKIGNSLGSNVDLLLKSAISKMQLVESLKVIMNLVMIFAYLSLTQLDAVLNFLTTLPAPTGETALHYVLNVWLSRQSMFYGSFERKLTIVALCKLFEYGVTTQDSRLVNLTFKEQEIQMGTSSRIRTRSQSHGNVWVDTPFLLKTLSLLIQELQILRELRLNATETDTDDDDFVLESHMNTNTAGVLSELVLEAGDSDDEENEDDEELIKAIDEPLLQANLEQYLKAYLIQFSKNEHFLNFFDKLGPEDQEIWSSLLTEE